MTKYIHDLFLIISNGVVAHCDAPEPWQMGFQDPATPVMEGIIFFHNYLMFFLIVIGTLVFYLLAQIVRNFTEDKVAVPNKFTHSSALEIAWTILPALVLLLIAIPSFTLLYSLDELVDPAITVKIIGHQWYWSYEYSDYATLPGGGILAYDSYMTPTDELGAFGAFRLLEVDHRLVLPTNTHIRLLITSADVLHSWAVPSFGIKMDATPGRLSQTSLFIKRSGVYYGQCSEICGVNHAFMPIVVKAAPANAFAEWIFLKFDYKLKLN